MSQSGSEQINPMDEGKRRDQKDSEALAKGCMSPIRRENALLPSVSADATKKQAQPPTSPSKFFTKILSAPKAAGCRLQAWWDRQLVGDNDENDEVPNKFNAIESADKLSGLSRLVNSWLRDASTVCASQVHRDDKEEIEKYPSKANEYIRGPILKSEDMSILGELGMGGYGEVLRYYNVATKTEYAGKVVSLRQHPSKFENIKIAVLQNEIKQLSELYHDRIVKIIGYQQTDTLLIMFMEVIPGVTVEEKLKRDGPLTEAEARKVMKDVLEVMNYLHQKKRIVHGDIKSSNVMIAENCATKLFDFGLASSIQGKVRPDKEDIWNCGILFFEILIGNKPTEMNKVTNCPGYALPEGFSTAARNLMTSMTAGTPDRPSAAELLQHPFFLTPVGDIG